MFSPKAYLKHVTSGAGPFLAQGAEIKQNWQRFIRSCNKPNIKALGIMVSGKKVCSCFSLYKSM